MTDFEKCEEDLARWKVKFNDGYFYDNADYVIGMWIEIIGLKDACLAFNMDGDFEGWI